MEVSRIPEYVPISLTRGCDGVVLQFTDSGICQRLDEPSCLQLPKFLRECVCHLSIDAVERLCVLDRDGIGIERRQVPCTIENTTGGIELILHARSELERRRR